MSVTDEDDRPAVPAQNVIEELQASGALDALFAKIDAGEVQLTGDGGLVPGLIKAALERGLGAELTDHLGYEPGDPGGGAVRELPQRHDTEDFGLPSRADRAGRGRVIGTVRSRRGWCPRARVVSAASMR